MSLSDLLVISKADYTTLREGNCLISGDLSSSVSLVVTVFFAISFYRLNRFLGPRFPYLPNGRTDFCPHCFKGFQGLNKVIDIKVLRKDEKNSSADIREYNSNSVPDSVEAYRKLQISCVSIHLKGT